MTQMTRDADDANDAELQETILVDTRCRPLSAHLVGAGRVVDRVEGRQTTTTNVPYTFSEAERRYEGKLTFSPTFSPSS